jgi:hypothetical protein
MKKGLIVIVGIAILASGGYALSNVVSIKKANKNSSVIQLENGQEIKMGNTGEKGEFSREGDKPDVIGKIKSIDGDSIVIEQFDMSNMGGGRGEGTDSSKQASSERPTPTVSGETTIVLAEGTSYVKGADRGMRSVKGNDSEPEEISKSDLEEEDMISVWTLDDEKTVERIMVR